MAVRKAGRIATAVAAAALIGVAATACGPGDDEGSGSKESGASSVSQSPEAEVPAAKVPPHGAELADVPAKVSGGVITVGDPKAKHTVKVYEDPRCPFCKKFEENGAQALVKPVVSGKVKIEYTLASFLDRGTGHGSVNTVNALRAAVDAGKFAEFHAGVFANQPEESDDAFTPAFLLKIADNVKGLRGAKFDKAVKELTYKGWVQEAMKSFTDDGIQGTPTVLIDGKKPGNGESLYSEAEFAKVLKDAGIS